MKLSDDYEDRPVNMTLVNMAIIMSVIVLSIIGLVFWMNAPSKDAKNVQARENKQGGTELDQMTQKANAMKESVDSLISGSSLTSDDLDIWNTNYRAAIASEPETASVSANGEALDSVNLGNGDGIVTSKSDASRDMDDNSIKKSETSLADASAAANGAGNTTTENNVIKDADGNTIQQIQVNGNAASNGTTEDGLQTRVTHADGTEEMVDINPELAQNSYDYTKLMYQKPVMKYYVDGKKASYFGMDITKDQGVVDFNKFKKAGGEFVMLKLGGRGYSSGQMIVDEKFMDYVKGATDADLHIGAYFFSQAVSEEEAEEEADLVIQQLQGNKIDYPVVFRMETISGDVARADDLTNEERTRTALAFLNKIKDAGYIPMIYGDKEWLMTKYQMADFNGIEVWLSQETDIPDYPYQFGMWQYTTVGNIDGISGNIKLDICFKNYADM